MIENGPRELTEGASQSMAIMNSPLSFNCEQFSMNQVIIDVHPR